MRKLFNLNLILVSGWVCLILIAGGVSSLIGFRLGTKSLSEVDKTEIMQRQRSSGVRLATNQLKIVDEQQIFLKVNSYIRLQEEAQKANQEQSTESDKQN